MQNSTGKWIGVGAVWTVVVLATVGWYRCTVGAPPPTTWTDEAIVRDPQAYLPGLLARLEQQRQAWTDRVRTLGERQGRLQALQAQHEQTLADVRNVARRLATAYRQAQDEDRWPLKFANRSFEQADAKDLLERMQGYVDGSDALSAALADALAQSREQESTARQTLSSLPAAAAARAAADQIRHGQGPAGLADLRRIEEQLARLAAPASQPADHLPELEARVRRGQQVAALLQ